jgi:hypothetical protein
VEQSLEDIREMGARRLAYSSQLADFFSVPAASPIKNG